MPAAVVVNRESALGRRLRSAAATAGGRSASVATIASGKVADIGPTVSQADVESGSQEPGGEMARRPSTSTLGFASVAAMAVLGGWIFVAGTVVPALDTMRFGFPVYYTSSRLVVDGGWSPDVYDNAWFIARSLELTDGRIGEIYRPNTPVASLLAIPIASLDIVAARRIWLVADLALIAVTIFVLIAALPILRSPPGMVAVIALFLWWAPLKETVSLGQAYALMLALQAIALWAVVRERVTPAGASIGAALAAKLAAVPLLLLLAVRGSVRSVVVAVGTALVLAGLTIGFAGLDGWTRFIGVLGEDMLRPPPSIAVTAFQSTTGLFCTCSPRIRAGIRVRSPRSPRWQPSRACWPRESSSV